MANVNTTIEQAEEIVRQRITSNDRKEITGQALQDVLLAIIYAFRTKTSENSVNIEAGLDELREEILRLITDIETGSIMPIIDDGKTVIINETVNDRTFEVSSYFSDDLRKTVYLIVRTGNNPNIEFTDNLGRRIYFQEYFSIEPNTLYTFRIDSYASFVSITETKFVAYDETRTLKEIHDRIDTIISGNTDNDVIDTIPEVVDKIEELENNPLFDLDELSDEDIDNICT